jgi:uncharacterized protein YprB with RNaseH-like and TPR domain
MSPQHLTDHLTDHRITTPITLKEEKPSLAPMSTMPKVSASSTVLDDALAMIENSSEYLALDLETTGLDPRASEIRLVQVSNGEKTYVLDLWKGLDPRPLFEALAKKTVLVHGGDFEWRFI